MAKQIGLVTLSLFLLVAFGSTAHGQEFYNNKTIRTVVGFSPGGGMDIYGRAIGRHLGKNIPGKPNVIVENMPGAGSLIAANYLYKQAKPDGLTIGSWIGGLVLQQVIGGQKGIEFDARKFEWIGVPAGDSSSCAVTKAGGVTSIEQWFAAKTPVKIGAMAPGSVTSDIPKILKAALNLPIQVVEGYKGTAEIRVAADSGEVDGGCWGWETIKIMWRQGLDAGNTKVLIQMLPKRHPDLPDVPNALELAKTQDARQLIKVGIVDPATMVRALSLPPGTPKDRVKILRDAFMATMKDPQFLAEAKTAKLDLNPMPGDDVEKIVHGFFALEPRTVAKLKDVVMSKH
jgi:tripartite-type tricarboxylate transporter receptor subunit TctC